MVSSVSNPGGQGVESLSDRHSRMFGRLDKDGSGGLDVDEFSAMLAKAPGGAPQVSDAKATFASFDSDGNGSLSQSELDSGMKSLRESSQSTVDRFGSGSSIDETMQKLLAALKSSSGSTDATSSTTSTADSSEATAKKLSQMFEQMAQAFASVGGQQASTGLSVTA